MVNGINSDSFQKHLKFFVLFNPKRRGVFFFKKGESGFYICKSFFDFDTYYSKDFVGMPILPKQRNFITRFHWEIQLLVVAFFDQILTMSSWAQLSEETDTCFTFYTSCTIIRFIWNSQDVWFDIYWYFIEWFFQDFAAFEDLAIRSQINGFSLVGSKPVGF